MSANSESTAVDIGLEKFSFHSNPKECSNYRTIALISHASKIMLKILQTKVSAVCELRMSRCRNWILKKQRNQRSNCQHLLDHSKSKIIKKQSARSIKKQSALLTILNTLTMPVITKYGKFQR